jgi:hypothetical protein
MATKVTMTYVIDGIPPAHDRDLIRAIKDMLGGSEWGRQALEKFTFDIKRERSS